MTIYFLLAAYNEEKDLPVLLEDFSAGSLKFNYRVVLVNDGSTDRTEDAARLYQDRIPLDIVTHKLNRGLGKALSTGLYEILRVIKEGDSVVTMDADRTHPVSTVLLMEEWLNAGDDIVIASRFCEGGKVTGVPFYRKLLTYGANALAGSLFRFKGVRDYTSGFRAFSGRILLEMRDLYAEKIITEEGFAATMELLLKAAPLAAGIKEVPLQLHYELKSGASKMKVLKTVGRYFVLFSKLRKLKIIQKK